MQNVKISLSAFVICVGCIKTSPSFMSVKSFSSQIEQKQCSKKTSSIINDQVFLENRINIFYDLGRSIPRLKILNSRRNSLFASESIKSEYIKTAKSSYAMMASLGVSVNKKNFNSNPSREISSILNRFENKKEFLVFKISSLIQSLYYKKLKNLSKAFTDFEDWEKLKKCFHLLGSPKIDECILFIDRKNHTLKTFKNEWTKSIQRIKNKIITAYMIYLTKIQEISRSIDYLGKGDPVKLYKNYYYYEAYKATLGKEENLEQKFLEDEKEIYSRANASRSLSIDKGLLSLCRKDINAYVHAFILVERLIRRKSGYYYCSIKRYDLFKHEDYKSFGQISIHTEYFPFKWYSKVMNLMFKKEKICAKTWDIKIEKLERLHKNIENEKNHMIKYSRYGKKSIITTSKASSHLERKKYYHNCVSWVEEMLKSINDNRINAFLKERESLKKLFYTTGKDILKNV